LFPKEEAMVLQGQVAWASQIPSSDRYQLGIEFTEKNEDNQQTIRKYVISNQLT
jgi:Tfp pilus assembly protein PilZ